MKTAQEIVNLMKAYRKQAENMKQVCESTKTPTEIFQGQIDMLDVLITTAEGESFFAPKPA